MCKKVCICLQQGASVAFQHEYRDRPLNKGEMRLVIEGFLGVLWQYVLDMIGQVLTSKYLFLWLSYMWRTYLLLKMIG